jgi:hypothetical protein
MVQHVALSRYSTDRQLRATDVDGESHIHDGGR